MKKTISVVIPCYNDAGNVEQMSNEVAHLFDSELKDYNYELIFIDNYSEDGTRDILRKLCSENKNVKAILNARNFGVNNSPVYGMLQASGDCVVLMACDFQEPVGTIKDFVHEWEKGAQVVAGVRSGSKQNPIMYGIRSLYYKLINKGSGIDTIDHFTGFGLYDRKFVETVRTINDPTPFIRGMVAEFGCNVKTVYYEQAKRKTGKTHHSFADLYDIAMVSFTSYTSMGLRAVTFLGFFISFCSFIIGMFYLVFKLARWNTFNAGMAPVLIGLFFLGSIVLVARGFIGEYIMSINHRIMHRPIVIEEERLGFEEEKTKED